MPPKNLIGYHSSYTKVSMFKKPEIRLTEMRHQLSGTHRVSIQATIMTQVLDKKG